MWPSPRHLKTGLTPAGGILKSGGVLSLIWRADGLTEVLAALDRGFGSLAILPVHGDAEAPAIRVLVRAIKGGRAPTRIHAALVLNDQPAVPNQTGAATFWPEMGYCHWRCRDGETVRKVPQAGGGAATNRLARQRFRLALGRRGEVDCG